MVLGFKMTFSFRRISFNFHDSLHTDVKFGEKEEKGEKEKAIERKKRERERQKDEDMKRESERRGGRKVD